MKRIVLVLAALLAGCATAEHSSPLSVGQLQARQQEMHGRVVLVQGYLGACRYSLCSLSSSPGGSGSGPTSPATLSVAGDHGFAAAVSMISPAEIVLKARVGGQGLRDPETGAIRPDCCDLEAIEVVKVVREIDENPE